MKNKAIIMWLCLLAGLAMMVIYQGLHISMNNIKMTSIFIFAISLSVFACAGHADGTIPTRSGDDEGEDILEEDASLNDHDNAIMTGDEVDRTPPHVTNDPGQKLYQLSLNWGRVPVREDSFWKESIGATVSPEEARILKWLLEVGTGNRHSARLATGSTSRQTRQMLDHLVVNGLIETVDEEDERYRLADHVREIMETTPEVAPEATPEATPEVTPEARLVGALSGEMSRRELRKALRLKGDEHFRKSYLIPALNAGLVEMTIPDKPRSSLQKYRLTTPASRDS